ncbi:LamG-like jellyroll fold domain-containing protein [Planktothrix sp. FACHB-1365]|uniref:LamG-like jellyroll fold domain-containing protein n=1 Tax=Planktothrix sp. FACHB-1365 TaxID=2692855 RepID=UPI001685DDB8|nr:LamG-like jellyroll fold domain-containing protein [Planktothrix sp. FACHB-1365]MBD2483426.1 hypothetical protein [Planktothrix sp. FACHB-1365]
MDNQYVLSFDGKDDYVSIPTMNVDYSQGFTVEAWVLYHSFQVNSRVIDFGNGKDSNNIVFHTKGTARKLYLVVAHNSIQQGIESEEVLETGVWIHVAATIDKSGNATLYKNGQVVKTGPVNLPLNVNRTTNYIAKSNWGESFFHGCMTELRVWNIARSAAEIQASTNSRLNGDEKGLVQYWPLNKISGDTVVNLTSNGHDGTVYGATLVEAPQLELKPATPKPIENLESVFKFDGQDDYVSIPAMNVDYSQGFTVEAWVLYHSFPCWSRIIDFGNGLQIDNIIFANDALTGKLVIGIVVGGPAVESKILETEVLETGVWMHLAATIDKSGNTTLYKNGQVVKTGSVALPRNMNRTLNYIGKSNYPDNDNFHGCMTEVRVWNIARSTADIQGYKNSRLNGDEKGLVQYWPLNEISGDTVVNLTSNGHHGTIHGATLVSAKPQLQLTRKTFLIKSKLNGLAVVGTPHSQVTTGAVDSKNPLQRWTITPDGVIKNEADFVLEYKDYNILPYYVVIANRIQENHGSPSQQWRIENGVIKNKHKADLVVDIAGSNPEPNTAILAAPGMGGLNQKWEIVSV